MKKNKNKCLFFVFSFCLTLFFFSKTYSNENINFLSLKNNEVNLRLGPSFEYPIKLIYKKKYLPVLILDKSETWRKTKDLENNSGWLMLIKKCEIEWCKISSGQYTGWILKNSLWGKIK